MKVVLFSKPAAITDSPTADPIYLFTQYFVHKDPVRRSELAECLRRNSENPLFSRVILLNERVYAREDGVPASAKILQENIGKRLTYQEVFRYIRASGLRGYFVVSNSDIFFDETIENVRMSSMHETKSAFALLRHEYDGKTDLARCPLFGPRFDSQDAWIFHSSQMVSEREERAFLFELGKPGCDNKLAYILSVLGYTIINDPAFVKIYHYHTSQTRNYTAADVIDKPWAVVVPCGANPYSIAPSLGIDLAKVSATTNGFRRFRFEDNSVLFEYIKAKMDAGAPFIVPRPSRASRRRAAGKSRKICRPTSRTWGSR
jgi:hypothetical protein